MGFNQELNFLQVTNFINLKINLPIRDKVATIIILLLITVALINQCYKSIYLSKNTIEVIGVIIDFKHKKGERYELIYNYEIKGVIYRNYVSTNYFNCDNGKAGCVGEKFKVKYSSDNYKVSEIYLGKYEQFKRGLVLF